MEENIKCKSMDSPRYADRPQYSADLIHRYALEWLGRQTKEEPFLGIFTYTLPHAELWQPCDSIVEHYHGVFPAEEERSYRTDAGSWYYGGNDKHAQFAAMITRLDTYVGEILEKLRESGLDKNTLVIFTSDNGPHEEGGADPGFFGRDGKLRGIKRSTYEGGIRIPFICWGAGIPKGKVSHHQLAFYDLMPTFMEYSGAFSKKEIKEHSLDSPRYDGISFCPTLLGKDRKQQKHEFLYWEMSDGGTQVIGVRKGDWKLVVSQGKPFLYDLSTDIHEDHDLKADYPDKLAELINIVHQEHEESLLFPISLP